MDFYQKIRHAWYHRGYDMLGATVMIDSAYMSWSIAEHPWDERFDPLSPFRNLHNKKLR
jgi:hypothetical protein